MTFRIEEELGLLVTDIWRSIKKATDNDEDFANEVVRHAFAYTFKELTTFSSSPISTKSHLLNLAKVFGPQFKIMDDEGLLSKMSSYDIVSALR